MGMFEGWSARRLVSLNDINFICPLCKETPKKQSIKSIRKNAIVAHYCCSCGVESNVELIVPEGYDYT